MDEVIKYDGTDSDAERAIETFYEWSAWDLASELSDARVLASKLLDILIDTEDWTVANLIDEGVALPFWATR